MKFWRHVRGLRASSLLARPPAAVSRKFPSARHRRHSSARWRLPGMQARAHLPARAGSCLDGAAESIWCCAETRSPEPRSQRVPPPADCAHLRSLRPIAIYCCRRESQPIGVARRTPSYLGIPISRRSSCSLRRLAKAPQKRPTINLRPRFACVRPASLECAA